MSGREHRVSWVWSWGPMTKYSTIYQTYSAAKKRVDEIKKKDPAAQVFWESREVGDWQMSREIIGEPQEVKRYEPIEEAPEAPTPHHEPESPQKEAPAKTPSSPEKEPASP